MHGYTREELLGKNLQFLSAEGKNNFVDIKEKFFWLLAANRKVSSFAAAKNRENFIQDIKLYKGIYFGKDVLIVYARDITKRKQAEEKFKRHFQKKRTSQRSSSSS